MLPPEGFDRSIVIVFAEEVWVTAPTVWVAWIAPVFVGIAVHCAKTSNSVCAKNEGERPDVLPDEPGGYAGFQALFGAKYVNPAICRVSTDNCTTDTVNKQPALKKLDGTPITDQFGQPGFPGFDGLFASTTLSYVAQMQEAGIPCLPLK